MQDSSSRTVPFNIKSSSAIAHDKMADASTHTAEVLRDGRSPIDFGRSRSQPFLVSTKGYSATRYWHVPYILNRQRDRGCTKSGYLITSQPEYLELASGASLAIFSCQSESEKIQPSHRLPRIHASISTLLVRIFCSGCCPPAAVSWRM